MTTAHATYRVAKNGTIFVRIIASDSIALNTQLFLCCPYKLHSARDYNGVSKTNAQLDMSTF